VTEIERMPSLFGGNNELRGGKRKIRHKFTKPNTEPLPKPDKLRLSHHANLGMVYSYC
jgi:hypothetical protein